MLTMYKNPTLFLIASQPSSPALTVSSSKIHFNVILPSIIWLCIWPLNFRSPNKSPLHISPI